MFFARPILAGLALVLGFGTAGFAGDLPDAGTFAKGLYKTNKRAIALQVRRADLVPENYKKALEIAVRIQKYYEAMAASPSEGMLAKSASLAGNFHDLENARATAVRACNAKKKKDSEACVVIAEFLPKGYQPSKGATLSYIATEDFKSSYRRAKNNKAFAISRATGAWGKAVGAASTDAAHAAALADCAKNGAKDCTVISEN